MPDPGGRPVNPTGARDEYLDASANARQYITLRFAELTIFMTATGAIMAVSFSAVAAPLTPTAAMSRLSSHRATRMLIGLVGLFWVVAIFLGPRPL